MPDVPCFYAPVCVKTYSTRQKMNHHRASAHAGLPDLFCPECEPLRTFKTSKLLQSHPRNHDARSCEHCGKEVSRTNWSRHVKSCAPEVEATSFEEAGLGDEDEEKSEEAVVELEPLFRPPPTGIHRHKNLAPSHAELMEYFPDFVAWVMSDTSLGKHKSIRRPESFLSKFRTALGKLADFHNLDGITLMKRLKRPSSCQVIFHVPRLNAFTMVVELDVNKQPLNKSTVYNYLRTLVVFLNWRVDVLQQVSLKESRDMLHELCFSVSKHRVTDRDPQAKADRLLELPSYSDILAFVDNDLKNRMDEARGDFEESGEPTWETYIPFRNYFLVVLLFSIPPQRLQVFNMIKREEIKIVNGFVVMTVKRHKTYHIYGPVVVVLPPRFTSDFEVYLQHRDNLARSGCSSLFIDRRGEQEPYLTKRFQKLVYMKFGKVVSIRDCRSIYVTKASKQLNMQQLYSLSRQMYHSFQTQQTIYRADDSTQRAMESVRISDRVSGLLPVSTMGEEGLSAQHIQLLERESAMDIDSDDEHIPVAELLARHNDEVRGSGSRAIEENDLSAEEELDLFAFPSDAEMLELLDTVESQIEEA
ncbi:hypothetical protein FI667_g8412, partial [Globisporangium splendens]